MSDNGSDHFLTLAELRFPSKWLRLPKNTTSKENILRYKIILLNDESTQWLYKQRIQQELQEISRKQQYNVGMNEPVISMISSVVYCW